MNIRDKANLHHALAQAYDEGIREVQKVKQATLLEAKEAVKGLLVQPATCMNPGEVLTKAALKKNELFQRAVYQIDQLNQHHFPGDEDDDVPF